MLKQYHIRTAKQKMHDITKQVREAAEESGVRKGIEKVA